MAFTFLKSSSPSFHTLVVSFSTHIDELLMELVYGQLLQKELWFM
jgi:hypothetical protein